MNDALRVLVLTVVLGLAVAAASLLTPGAGGGGGTALECVTGEDARNPTQAGPDGRVITLPTNREFATIGEAERWICLDVPQPEPAPGWILSSVLAERGVSLDMFDGHGARMVELYYRNPGLGAWVRIMVPGGGYLDAPGGPQEIEVQGKPGKLWISPEFPVYWMQWGEGRDAVLVAAFVPEGADLGADVMPFLETIR